MRQMETIVVPALYGPDGTLYKEEDIIESKMGYSDGMDQSGNSGLEIEVGVTGENNRAIAQDHQDIEALQPPNGVVFHEEMSPGMLEVAHKGGNPIQIINARTLLALDALIPQLARRGRRMFPFGTFPYRESISEAEMIDFIRNHPDPYYKYLLEQRDGLDLSNLDCASLQLHYQESNGETAVRMYEALKHFIPIFAALSASSPLYKGLFRGSKSSRLTMKKGLSKSGIPPTLESFVSFMEQLKSRIERVSPDTIQGVLPGYYLLRMPRVDIGTLEFCACDMSPDMDLNLALFDLYIRLCTQIARYVTEGRSLPHPFSNAERIDAFRLMDIENNLDGLLKANRHLSQGSITGTDGILYTPEQYMSEVFAFLDGTECTVNGLLPEFGATDVTELIIMRTIMQGSVADQILRTLNLRGFGTQQEVSDELIEEAYLPYVDRFEERIQQLVSNLSSNATTTHRPTSISHAV